MANVIIERLPPGDYGKDCVALTGDYGSASWENRHEVKAIRKAVLAALDSLDARTGIGATFRDRPVLVKPNLVTVYHEMGLTRRPYARFIQGIGAGSSGPASRLRPHRPR